MKRNILAVLLLLTPFFAFAHQPRIVDEKAGVITISGPEISKAYYGKLEGKPQVFQFSASETLPFYMNILVPTTTEGKKDVSATLYNENNPNKLIITIGGEQGTWKLFHEEFGNDDYYQSTEYKADIPAGNYEIRVTSTSNDSLYSLAVGETESFPLVEIARSFITLPHIKSFFFDKPFYSAFITPFLGGPILLVLLVSGALIYIVRRIRVRE